MTIELSDDDRALLERLEKGRMKPTRRQKAIALLRLATGLSSADAAKHAGIPKEEVEALAKGYARGGLRGVGLVGTQADEPWRATIPAFQDDELFRQYTEALEASRRERIPDEFPEA